MKHKQGHILYVISCEAEEFEWEDNFAAVFPFKRSAEPTLTQKTYIW